MASEVNGVGKGFFSEAGDLKSKDQIAREAQVKESKPKEGEASEQPADSTQFSETTITNAIGLVRTRFSEKANSIVSVVNQNEAGLKEAGDVVKEQLGAAKELKAALKDGDEKKANAARAKLDKLAERRDEVAEKIEATNRETATDRVKNLNLGNQQVGIVKVDAVKFERGSADKIETQADVNKFINRLKDDRSAIASQRQELREVKRDVKKVIKDTDQKLSRLEEGSIRDFKEAERTSQKVAASIVNVGAQAVAVSKISEKVAQTLLQ